MKRFVDTHDRFEFGRVVTCVLQLLRENLSLFDQAMTQVKYLTEIHNKLVIPAVFAGAAAAGAVRLVGSAGVVRFVMRVGQRVTWRTAAQPAHSPRGERELPAQATPLTRPAASCRSSVLPPHAGLSLPRKYRRFLPGRSLVSFSSRSSWSSIDRRLSGVSPSCPSSN